MRALIIPAHPGQSIGEIVACLAGPDSKAERFRQRAFHGSHPPSGHSHEDVDRLVKFYTNSFGLKVVKGVGTATYLTDGHLNLAIIPIVPNARTG